MQHGRGAQLAALRDAKDEIVSRRFLVFVCKNLSKTNVAGERTCYCKCYNEIGPESGYHFEQCGAFDSLSLRLLDKCCSRYPFSTVC